MYLNELENQKTQGIFRLIFKRIRKAGGQIPQILHLFRFKIAATKHLGRYTQAVMRGPSPLSAATREMIAAFVSTRNRCLF
jgi:hypothetical protein